VPTRFLHPLPIFAIIVASFAVLNGIPLAFLPKYFLRVYDWYARGDFIGRTAKWRAKTATPEYKIAGAAIAAFGIYIIYLIVHG
jgi:hypothetical protein